VVNVKQKHGGFLQKGERIMTVETTDLYEASFYLCNGCTIETIQGMPVNNDVACKFIIAGSKITDLQLLYFQGKASINLFMFRRAYSQVNSYIKQAKKRLKKELQEQNASRQGVNS
jgi:hypothetical protein